MIAESRTNNLFFKFIETFSPVGFIGVGPDNGFITRLTAIDLQSSGYTELLLIIC